MNTETAILRKLPLGLAVVLVGLSVALGAPRSSAGDASNRPAERLTTQAASRATEESSAEAAERVIRKLVDEAFSTLKDAQLAKDEKKRAAKLRQVVDRAFDWVGMARSSLGPRWRKLSEAQRNEFVEIFEELLARHYMDDLDRFQGTERVEFRGTRERGSLVVVRTILVTASKEQLPIDYTLEKQAKDHRVVDFSVEGVSLVNHYRKSFSAFLVNNSFEELLRRLKRKLGLS